MGDCQVPRCPALFERGSGGSYGNNGGDDWPFTGNMSETNRPLKILSVAELRGLNHPGLFLQLL
jgi:hypothetical protein